MCKEINQPLIQYVNCLWHHSVTTVTQYTTMHSYPSLLLFTRLYHIKEYLYATPGMVHVSMVTGYSALGMYKDIMLATLIAYLKLATIDYIKEVCASISACVCTSKRQR